MHGTTIEASLNGSLGNDSFGSAAGTSETSRLKHALLSCCAAFALSVSLLSIPSEMANAGSTLSDLKPVTDDDYYDQGRPSVAKVELGRALFFDKILSGNRNIACATCHHPKHASGDGVSLSLGEGASDLGPKRRASSEQQVLGRVPRNAQPLFNLGAREFSSMYHDGRVEPDLHGSLESGFWSPAREQLPSGLDSVLAAQAMFPVLSPIEMAGHQGDNAIADAVATDRLGGADGAWELIAKRLRQIPDYVALFQAAFAEIDEPEGITFVHAANAIATFEATAFRADQSPFDLYLRTRDRTVMSEFAARGMDLFYGKAACAACHGGKFQTDQAFHAIAMPQVGPGKGDGSDPSYWEESGFPAKLEDWGRYRVTFDKQDLFRFRTPSLRNIELTGPYGHAGSYATLEAVVRHHLDPVASLRVYDVNEATLPMADAVIEKTGSGSRLQFAAINPARLDDYRKRDRWVQQTPALLNPIADANALFARPMSDQDVTDLVAFLEALTDPRSRDLDHLVPAAVPSGLPVVD